MTAVVLRLDVGRSHGRLYPDASLPLLPAKGWHILKCAPAFAHLIAGYKYGKRCRDAYAERAFDGQLTAANEMGIVLGFWHGGAIGMTEAAEALLKLQLRHSLLGVKVCVAAWVCWLVL